MHDVDDCKMRIEAKRNMNTIEYMHWEGRELEFFVFSLARIQPSMFDSPSNIYNKLCIVYEFSIIRGKQYTTHYLFLYCNGLDTEKNLKKKTNQHKRQQNAKKIEARASPREPKN